MEERVAIIGGGMTGLALAYFLGQAGWRVTIIEKGPALSGLLGFTAVDGVPIERYYHHFFTHDEYQVALLHELGLADKILWRTSDSAIYRAGRLFPFVTKTDYLRLPFLSWPEKIRGGVAALAMRRQRPEDLPAELTAETYLRRLFGERGWETMWRPLSVNKFGAADTRHIPAQWIAKRIQVRGGSTKGGREVLGYLDGSYRVLVDGLVTAITAQGGQVELNCQVQHLPRTAAGKFTINGQVYDQVISTIAPNLMQRIVPELAVPTVAYRAAICPLFILQKKITPYYWINNLDPDVPFSVVVNQQALLPAEYYHGRWPVYVGHYVDPESELLQKTNEELFAYYLGYLEKMFPGIGGEIVGYEIGRTKYAQPVPHAPWQPLTQTTNVPHLFMTSMAHIYPEDRGVNYAIREAQRLRDRLLAIKEKNLVG